MRSTPSEPLLLHNTMRVEAGRLEEFKEAVAEAVTFVERFGPQLMVQVFVDDDEMVAHSFQLYADSAAIRRHWELADPHIQRVMQFCTVERLTMYGRPDRTVADAVAPVDVDPATRAIVPRLIGFVRTPDDATTA